MNRKTLSIIRDLFTSFVIGGLSTYLPIWILTKAFDRFFIGFAVGTLMFLFMLSTNVEERME